MASWQVELLEIWTEGQRLSAVGPGPVSAHLELASAMAGQLDEPETAVDLGSGAGIPGLALAGLWPRSRWTLIDAAKRRVSLLVAAVDRLGWTDRVAVIHGRAEDIGRRADHREGYDLVIARSFGPPAVTAECASPLVSVGGRIVVTEPPEPDPGRWPPPGLSQLGLEPAASDPAAEPRLQHLVKVAALDDRYPRRAGVPSRRPLF